MAGLSSPGIGSGLDVNTLVSKLMSIEQQPLTQLDTQEASYQTKITALGSLKGAVSSLQGAVAALNDPTKFTARTASSSDSSVLSGSATTIATPGSYSMVVSSLAQVPQCQQALRQARMAEIADGPDVAAIASALRAANAELLLAARVDLTPTVGERIAKLSADDGAGIKVFHVCADLHGREKAAAEPRHIKSKPV